MKAVKNILAAAGAVFIAVIVLMVLVSVLAGPGIGGDKVAVVEIEGLITDSVEVGEQLKGLAGRKDVKAVVVRIDSPGGAVGPSQEIYGEIKRLRRDKKVVASMGTIAASGGYYAAVAADRIVANPGTITGSIGVLVEFVNAEGLMSKIGLKGYVVKTGRYKDMGSPFREMEPDEEKMLRAVLDDVRDQFVAAVAEGRGKTVEEVSRVADGRIFTGSQAASLGFIDELGGLKDAIDLGAELAGIKGEPEVIYTRSRGLGFREFVSGAVSRNITELFSNFRILYLTPNPQW